VCMAERVGFSNVVHQDCDRCNPDSLPTDGHGKPVFWAKYACTVIIGFSDITYLKVCSNT
jgi:hypothetical protein